MVFYGTIIDHYGTIPVFYSTILVSYRIIVVFYSTIIDCKRIVSNLFAQTGWSVGRRMVVAARSSCCSGRITVALSVLANRKAPSEWKIFPPDPITCHVLLFLRP